MVKKISEKLAKNYKNKTILITGGTGSIGTALAEELIKCKPKAIRILTNDENSIFEAKQILGNNSLFTYIIADIKDRDRIRLAMRNADIVFHAAAMKHIDICEENPFDAVKTNVIGTSNMIEISLLENISKFVFISTDKAVNPTSTLGASKLLAERLTKNASAYKGRGKTNFSIVRFGNVIGSRGSVFQIFHELLKQNKSLVVTDSKMTRFIMSISEAAGLILEVPNIAKDGEIFILKMPSIKISELAKSMIEVYQKNINKKNNSTIKISNSRNGERLQESLITEEEIPYCNDMGKMFKISNIQTGKKINSEQFNSATAKKMSKSELNKIIQKLLEK